MFYRFQQVNLAVFASRLLSGTAYITVADYNTKYDGFS